MSLQDEIDGRRKEIQTDGYAMSVGELANLYVDGDLDIHPEFQRFFRWSRGQKSRFIESLLLGIPIPSLFVYQRDDGAWDVIDGLQRLSTVFELMGELKDEEGKLHEPGRLKGTRYLPSLEGKTWDDNGNGSTSLDDTQRRLIKRAALDLKIVKRESDPDTPFELFQRLNGGGSQLSDQELRNALLIMVDRSYYFWLKALQERDSFQLTVAPSERALEEQYDLELVLRFLALFMATDEQLRAMGDVTEFLTDAAVEMARNKSFERDPVKETFDATFDLIGGALEDLAFRRHDAGRDRFLGGFSVSAYEAVTTGVAANLAGWTELDAAERNVQLEQRVKALWANQTFRQYARGGVRASTRIPQIIPLGRELFAV